MAKCTKPPELPENLLDLTCPALPETDLAALAALSASSPEQFQAALGAALRKMVIQGFQTLQAPRNWKEQATAMTLLGKMEGWDKEQGKATQAGLVGVLRSVARRTVVDIPMEADEGDMGFE